jgi:hydroxymethylpyrimidine/phosphomethylpyrimidine kinase
MIHLQNHEINEEVEITLTPNEFEAIQYALQSIVRHESVSHAKHYSHLKNASQVLMKALTENKKDRINPFWGSDYRKK